MTIPVMSLIQPNFLHDPVHGDHNWRGLIHCRFISKQLHIKAKFSDACMAHVFLPRSFMSLKVSSFAVL